ncbi:hypothetical protein [Methylorubrum zatmanii]
MVVALLALSLVMILGGFAAVVQGFPYVRLESGLAMVIGGSTAASAGVILLGLTAVLDRLRRLQGSLAQLNAAPLPAAGESRPVAEAPPWQATSPAPSQPIPEVEPPQRPSLTGLGAAGLGAAGLAGLSLGALRPGGRGSEPVFDDPTPPAEPHADAAEPLLPDLLDEPAPETQAEHKADPDADLFGEAEPHLSVFSEPEPAAAAEPPEHETTEEATPAPETLGLRSSLDEPAPAAVPERSEAVFTEPPPAEAVADEPAAPEAEESEPAPEEERHAVGSYSSGANTYVMFSDGSIEADTPRGRFTFASLDELKSFVNAGGEEARGAA